MAHGPESSGGKHISDITQLGETAKRYLRTVVHKASPVAALGVILDLALPGTTDESGEGGHGH